MYTYIHNIYKIIPLYIILCYTILLSLYIILYDTIIYYIILYILAIYPMNICLSPWKPKKPRLCDRGAQGPSQVTRRNAATPRLCAAVTP